jgi:chemotaxis signal transduction protein
MAIYLQVRAASIHLMLDALHVHEVLNSDTVLSGASDHAQWRDDVISTVDLAKLFGLSGGNIAMGVVYTTGNESRPVMLLIDEVLGLKDLQAAQWSRLPRIPSGSALFFNSVWLEGDTQRQSFRLRHPLDNPLFGISA